MELEKKNIYLPEITPGTVYRKDLELDGNLNEDQPDIARLIRIDARTSAPSVSAENGKLCVKCDVTFGILYESDYRGKAAYAQNTAAFSCMTDIPAPAGEYYPFADIRCTYLTCKLLGARRYVIRAVMETSASVIAVREQPVTDIPEDARNMFFRTAELACNLPCRVFTEERSASGSALSAQSVAAVLFTDYGNSAPEWTAEEGRLTVKVPVTLKAFCETEEGGFAVVPFSAETVLTSEDPDITAESMFSVDAHVRSCSASPESDEYGENRVIRFNYTVCANAVCFERSVENAASDVFCADRTADTVCKRISYRDPQSTVKKDFVISKDHDTERGDIRGADDVCMTFSVSSAECADGVLTVKGAYNADLLADTDSGIAGISFDGDFEETLSCEGADGVTDVRVFASGAEFSVKDGGVVAVRMKACLCAEPFVSKETDALVSASVSEPSDRLPAGLRFYYPDTGESAWDIAKRCRVDPEKLVNDNPEAFLPDGTLSADAVFVAIK